eukprot:TRINITY_DN115347_c0_g1_i1.p1 TRINITY_DN115347_c0_g1~~TRINITY_DN115347_c0_g1_i1.p1  ORF type:complete len:224 (+),score=47.77 TRINITY_DN115347_c0_g1_i1:74-745(+)
MAGVMIKHSKRQPYPSLKFGYPETFKLLLNTLDKTPDPMLNPNQKPALPRPSTTGMTGSRCSSSKDARARSSLPGPSAEALLEMSHDELLEHLQRRSARTFRSRAKDLRDLRRSSSQPDMDRWQPAATTAFADFKSSKGLTQVELLSVTRSRNSGGRTFGADKRFEKVGFLGMRDPIPYDPSEDRVALDPAMKKSMDEEKATCHILKLKKSGPRNWDGMWYAD